MTVAVNDEHNVFYNNEIKEDTITVALDYSGGMSDRLMLGRKGILVNANASIECFNFSTDEEKIAPFEVTDDISDEDLERAIAVLQSDNFDILMVLNQPIVAEDLIIGRDLITIEPFISKTLTVVDVEKVEFDEDNIYNIY